MNCSSYLTLMTWNARGLRRKKTEFKEFLASNKIHVALVTETHLQNNHRFNIPGYTIHRTDRDRQGGGTAVIVKHDIQHDLVPQPQLGTLESTNILINLDNTQLLIAAAYAPPGDIKHRRTKGVNAAE